MSAHSNSDAYRGSRKPTRTRSNAGVILVDFPLIVIGWYTLFFHIPHLRALVGAGAYGWIGALGITVAGLIYIKAFLYLFGCTPGLLVMGMRVRPGRKDPRPGPDEPGSSPTSDGDRDNEDDGRVGGWW